MDDHFSYEMDEKLKGSTDNDNMWDSDVQPKETGSSEKKKANMSSIAKTIDAEMRETNWLAEEMAKEMKEKNHLAKHSQLISVAQHLGKREILEQILASFSSSSNN